MEGAESSGGRWRYTQSQDGIIVETIVSDFNGFNGFMNWVQTLTLLPTNLHSFLLGAMSFLGYKMGIMMTML